MRCGQEGPLWSSVCENKNLKLKVGEMVENLEFENHIIKDRECLFVCFCMPFFHLKCEFVRALSTLKYSHTYFKLHIFSLEKKEVQI